MKKEKIFIIAVPILCVLGIICTYLKIINNNINNDSVKFKEEYEKLNGTIAYSDIKYPSLDISIDNLLDNREIISNLNFDNADFIELPSDNIKIPVLGFIKAGVPIEAQENIVEYIDIPKEWTKGNKKYYGLKISGDSMYPNYNENDTVIFLQTNDIQNGKDCAIMVNCTECTFKKVYINDQGIVLQPYNNSYAPMVFTKEQVEELPIKVVGIAVERRSKIN